MGTTNKSGGIEFAPLRTLDDFLLESARFQIPNVKDMEKWGKRVANNLLYYQTNYFLMGVIIFLIFGVLHPVKMVVGTIMMVLIFTVFCYVTNEGGAIGQFKKKHPVISSLIVFSVTYYVISAMIGSLVIFLLGILVPFCATFIHSSLRLRNIRNKLANRVETLGLTRTPMGIFLEQMGIEQESRLDASRDRAIAGASQTSSVLEHSETQ